VPTNLTFHETSVETPNGRVFLSETPGEDPPFVLLHGFPDDHRIYDRLVQRLSPRRAVALDFLGYGRSDRPDAPGFSAEEHASQLTAVLDRLGIGRAVIVGHDASGPDAVLYAVRHPDHVAGVVLLNTMFAHQRSLKMPEMTCLFATPDLTSLADDMINDPAQLLWLLQRWGAQLKLEDDPDDIVRGSILAQFYGDADQPDAIAAIRAWTARLLEDLDTQDTFVESGALRHLEVPVSIIFGEDDQDLNPSLAGELAELFEDPSLHLVAGAGHYVQHDQALIVAELLKAM
jgi:pimeloyl-ACP methyl ester carboxylesterase